MIMTFYRRLLPVLLVFLVGATIGCTALFAQSDLGRRTVAVTYPLDESVTVKFRGTTLLPRLKGEAKVKRAGRRGTRVELAIDNLPRANELGGIYTTFVLWAISPDGHVDNLGEIKRGGSPYIASKLDVTTPLQTFALIITAEPHFLMKVPSRMVVLENIPPRRPGNSQVETVNLLLKSMCWRVRLLHPAPRLRRWHSPGARRAFVAKIFNVAMRRCAQLSKLRKQRNRKSSSFAARWIVNNARVS